MTEARELLKEGRLADAIEAVTRDVKAQPSDETRRMFLFELLLFAGQWERAQKQLDAAAGRDAQSEAGAQVYRNNLNAMRARERLWDEGLVPHFISEPPQEVKLHLAAIGEWRAGRPGEARKLLAEAAERRRPLAGRVNGREFPDWRDADDAVAPVLELIISDKYTWLPFSQVSRLEFETPRRLRDLIWCPVRALTRAGVAGELLVPALYEGSSRHDDERVRLGRMTVWEGDEEGDGLPRAFGLRLFLAGDDELTLFEAGRVDFD
ncbi:MAG TPA: type VI secretion system accessory protein TagJ [Pyrinomonadaceae bacterium]|jgi:type VI secretion system protein ImpE|nr:type VI secretion system accessory protein TagJ [Pyrinomonadaceae bacterium]